jgi:hypothetical protein
MCVVGVCVLKEFLFGRSVFKKVSSLEKQLTVIQLSSADINLKKKNSRISMRYFTGFCTWVVILTY